MAAAAVRPAEWVALDQVRDLSRRLGESETTGERRQKAFERFLSLPIEPDPLYRGYGYFTNVDLSGLDALGTGRAVVVPPPPHGGIQVVHDVTGTRAVVPEALRGAGVRLRALAPPPEGSGESRSPDLLPAEEATDRLSALATALLNRGYELEVPDRVRAPIRVQDLTVLSRPHESISVRRIVRAGTDSQVLVTEEVYGSPDDPGGQRLYASRTELDLAAQAKIVYLTQHAPDPKAVSIYQRSATSGPGSRLAWIWAGLGGFRTKARNRSRLVGQGSVVDDFQLFYGAGEQSYDSAVHLTHVGTDTHAQSITRGVFTDKARGMSRGLVRIEHEAVKTLSFISEHAMLLSRGARSDTIPILEILCRDVKATHSSSVHPVDPDQVFYLRSRGLGEAEAVRMIAEGFLSYVLERAPVASLREILFPSLEARWTGADLFWLPDGSRALPELEVTGTEGAPEWRFDTKLR